MQNLLVKMKNKLLLYPTSVFSHRCLSTSLPKPTLQLQNPLIIKSQFAVEYLTKSCGLPLKKAVTVSKYIPHLKSPEKADSVLRFLQEMGLGKADIRKTLSIEPRILCASLEKTIMPRIEEMREIGFSTEQVARLVPLAPVLFGSKYGSLRRTVEFWKNVFGDLEGILRVLKKAPYILTVSVEKVIEFNISFLKEHCGVTASQIRVMQMRDPSLFTKNPSKLKQAAQKAEKLGIPHGGLFIYALQMANNHSASNLDAKIKNLKNLGFSDKEIESMIKKQPMLLSNSVERVQKGVLFLTCEAGLDVSCIAIYPALISLSLERRLIPRYYVVKSLKSEALCKTPNFAHVMIISEEQFMDKFITPYRDVIPKVVEDYETAIAGKISLKGKI